MCDQNCDNCEYKAVNRGRTGHCYMFKLEPEGMCEQFSMSREAIKSMSIDLTTIKNDFLREMLAP